jgi:hypothetical protein
MYIPEMPVYLPYNNLSLAGGSDMSVLMFQEWCCVDVTSVVGWGMSQAWRVIGSVEKKVLYCFHVVKTEQ